MTVLNAICVQNLTKLNVISNSFKESLDSHRHINQQTHIRTHQEVISYVCIVRNL